MLVFLLSTVDLDWKICKMNTMQKLVSSNKLKEGLYIKKISMVYSIPILIKIPCMIYFSVLGLKKRKNVQKLVVYKKTASSALIGTQLFNLF